MAPDPPATPAPAPPAPTIHEAEPEPGPSGAVLRGPEIDFDAAVARRQAGQDVVVCGKDVRANRQRAQSIESAVGPCQREDPHENAGPMALPHYQPTTRPPEGHTFY